MERVRFPGAKLRGSLRILNPKYCRGEAPLIKKNTMVEPLLSGIVLGLIPVTLSGLFVTAYLQYRRGDQLNF